MGRNDGYNRILFRKISEKSNYLDEEIVERVYMALLKVVAQELRAGNPVFLPHFGRMWLEDIVSSHDKRPIWVPKFKPARKFRLYFRNKYEDNSNKEGGENGHGSGKSDSLG